jgi:NTP pyrophosphatase (non-canonical NTP hydrolase)
MNLEELIIRATAQARKSGFTMPGKVRSVAEHVALITTEVGELYEAHRDGMLPHEFLYQHRGGEVSGYPENDERELGKPMGIPSEMADILIRVANMAGEYNIDLSRAVEEKMAYNATRPRMHGRKA